MQLHKQLTPNARRSHSLSERPSSHLCVGECLCSEHEGLTCFTERKKMLWSLFTDKHSIRNRPKCGHVFPDVSCWTLILNYKLQYDIIYKLVLSGSININCLCGWTLQGKINQRSSDQDTVHTLQTIFQTDFLTAPSWVVSKPNHQKNLLDPPSH